VGTDDHYLALYTPDLRGAVGPFAKGAPLNHVGVEVDELNEAKARVIAAGLSPFPHGDYPPGQRFYFLDPDGVEFEVISYNAQAARAA
jgi:catechol 2,3-dioxygenase-like lactoylglutathione lyase family enzyme